MSAPALVVVAVVLVALGGLFAAVDSALNTVSPARVEELAKGERPSAQKLLVILEDRPRYVNLMVLLRILCEITATVVLVAALLDWMGHAGALVASAVIMVLVDYMVIGVGPRTLGRQHAYPIALAGTVPLRVIGVLLGPLSRLLILIGNAITPAGDSGTGRSPTRSNCASWWTWRRSAASSPPRNGE